MGSIGGNSYIRNLESLTIPKQPATFPDSRNTPLTYDNSRLMEVNFGDWRTPDNFKGIQEIDVSNIVTTQPFVQLGKLTRFGSAIDTSDVPVLQIGDKYYVADGNHRIVSNVLSGRHKVRVSVYRR